MPPKKENLETKARKAVLEIEKTVQNIEYVLRDLNSQLVYLIQQKRYDVTEDLGYGRYHGGKRYSEIQKKMKCENCGIENENLILRSFVKAGIVKHTWICLKCLWILIEEENGRRMEK